MVNEAYREYLSYVKQYLIQNDGIGSKNSLHPFRNRFHHTIRVLHWCFRLTEGRKDVELEVLYTAAVFHDIGYGGSDNEYHAVRSAHAWQEYAQKHGIDLAFTEKVERLIYGHSNKTQLSMGATPLEMILLLEADLLDEEGAMGIVWDCMTVGNAHASSYAEAYYYIMQSSNKTEPNPMVTEKARSYWEEKKKIAADFSDKLKEDLMIGGNYFDI